MPKRKVVDRPPPRGREEVCRALIEAGTRLFAKHGPDSVLVRDVAAEARVNHSLVITAFISPLRAERQMARSLMKEGKFYEVFVDTPLALAEARDPKGLYKKARRGELKNFTGIDSPYEVPENPEMVIDTAALSAEQAANAIIRRLTEAGMTSGAG